MTKRIFRSILLVALAAFAACFLYMLWAGISAGSGRVKSNLRNEVEYIARGAEKAGTAYFDGGLSSQRGILWLSSDGAVLYTGGSVPSAEEMEEGIAEALRAGNGEGTCAGDGDAGILYCARRLEDGSVLCVSAERPSVTAEVVSVLLPMLCLIALVTGCAVFLSAALSRKIVAPLN